jgi:cell division septum initiation protein DivIVA
MNNGAAPFAGSGGGGFDGQMRGYSRAQVDAFAAKSRSQIHDLEQRLSRSLGELARLRTELAAARQALRSKPAPEQASGRVGQILKLAGEEADAQWARAQDEIATLRGQAQQEANRSRDDAREQADRMLVAARDQAQHTLTAAQADADTIRASARADSEQATSQAANRADSTLTAATSQATQTLTEATTRASAIHDRAERRLTLLTAQHTQAMRHLTQIQVAMATLVASAPALEPLDGETTEPPAPPPAAGSPAAAAPSAPAAAGAAQANHPQRARGNGAW